MFRYPTLPAQASFRAIDRAGHGLTTVVWEQALAPDTDMSVLARAVSAVGRRHEALRTTVLKAEDGGSATPNRLWHAFENVVAGSEHVMLERVTQPGHPRADPSRLPVFRFQLVQNDTGPTLRIVTDHSLCDRWSLLVLRGDIERAYESERTNRAPHHTAAYPFSRFVRARYGQWASGQFDSDIEATARRISELKPPAMRRIQGLPRWPFTQAYELKLGKESTSQFEAIRKRTICTRFAVALALFSEALRTIFDWREFVVLVPNANRPHEAAESVGLFSDSQIVISRPAGSFSEAAREIAAHLTVGIRGASPPAALMQERTAAREYFATAPRVTAELSFDSLPGERAATSGTRVFAPKIVGADPTDGDVIERAATSVFPVQPDLKLTCAFAERHALTITYRVDRIPADIAMSVAQEIREALHRMR